MSVPNNPVDPSAPRREEAEASQMAPVSEDAPLRQVQCEACHGEGRIYRAAHGGNDPDEISHVCFECGGDGWAIEEDEGDDEDGGCCPGCGACPGFMGAECEEGDCEWTSEGGGYWR